MKPLRLLILVCALFSLSAHSESAAKVSCSSRELELRDCTVKLKNWQVSLTKEKILLGDSVWRSAHDLPLIGAETAWHKVLLRQIVGRTFLELQIWGAPVGETHIQELHWVVVELLDKDAKVKLDEVIRRRRPKIKIEVPVVAARKASFPKSPPRPVFILDPEEKYSLLGAGRTVVWSVGTRRGDL